jgi:hypothetical protein
MKKIFSFMLFFLAMSAVQAETVTDVLDNAFTGVSGSSYTDWTNTGTSGAVYKGQSAGSNSTIQLRSNNSNSGIVTTTSGGKVQKIVVTWNSSTANGRTLDIYGDSTAYSAATELYGTPKGTKLGSIVCGTSTELTVTGDYEYIGLRSVSGAMYLDKIEITWGEEGGSEPPTPTYQTIPYTESLVSSQGLFTIEDVNLGGLTAVWKTSSYGMTANGNNCTDNVESWFISPLIDGTTVSAVNLTFDENLRYFANDSAATQEATLWVREGENGTWTQVTLPADVHKEMGNNTFVNIGDIDLSAYAGKVFQIGFKYTATTTNHGRWEIKNLAITEGIVPDPEIATVAQFNALDQGTTFVFTGQNLVATAQSGKYLYAQDETGGILIYGEISPEYTMGDVIPAGFTATKGVYSGAAQAGSPQNMEDAVDSQSVTAKEFVAADFEAATFAELSNFGIYGVLRGVTVDGNTITLADGTTVVNTFTTFAEVPTGSTSDIYDVYGIMSWHNGVQFLPVDYQLQAATAHAAPVITVKPEKDMYFVGDEVTVIFSSEETGVNIGYDIENSETFPTSYHPITNGDSITVTADAPKTVTVRAFAYGYEEGDALENSEVVTKEIVFLEVPVPGDKYELVTDSTQIAADNEYVLVYTKGDVVKAMGGNTQTTGAPFRSAVDPGITEFTLENGVVTLMSTTTVTPFVLETAKENRFYIKIDGKDHIYWSSGNSMESGSDGDEMLLTLDADGNVQIKDYSAWEERYLQYNESSPRFAFYKGTQKNAQLYVKVVDTPLLGDVNGDGEVDVRDITALIDVIMNSITDNPRADVSQDGSIDVRDITALIDIIMNS